MNLIKLSVAVSVLSFVTGSHLVAAGAPAAGSHNAVSQPAISSILTWERDLRASLQKAKAENKWVLVDVYTSWCGWCRKLDSDTYSDPATIHFLNKSYICVKVDADDRNLGQYIKQTFGVKGYPTILILNPSGSEKGRITGYRGPNDFTNAVLEQTR